MKKSLVVLSIIFSAPAFADYALVIASSGPTLNTLTISKTLEQCEKTKLKFEEAFKEIQYDEKRAKERYKLQCVELAENTTI